MAFDQIVLLSLFLPMFIHFYFSADFYRVAQPQFDPMPHSFDSPHVPYHQQILTYQPPKRSPMDKTRTFNNSSVELKNNQSSASTATGTLRSGSMGSRRDLE